MIEISTGTLIVWAVGLAGAFCALGFGLGIMFWAWYADQPSYMGPEKKTDLTRVITK